MKLCFDGVPVVKGSNSGGACDDGTQGRLGESTGAPAVNRRGGQDGAAAQDNNQHQQQRQLQPQPHLSSSASPKNSPSTSLNSSSSSSSTSSLSSSSSSSSPSSSPASSSSSSSNVTAFLSKLWRMVNDSHNDDQIRWSQSGCSFVIINQIQFAKDMLPLYFKHSNMASFIRQLNMYGFRKIPLMATNGSADQRLDVAQFYHVNFMRGQEQRLSSIKRKNNSSKTHNLVVNGSFCDEVRAILSDVKSIRDGQSSSESILGAIQLDNKSLWRDVAVLRNQHHKQRRVIEKLIQFLLSLIQNRNSMVKKRRMKSIISPDELMGGEFLFNMTASEADEGLLQMGGSLSDAGVNGQQSSSSSSSSSFKKESGELASPNQNSVALNGFGGGSSYNASLANSTSHHQMVSIYHQSQRANEQRSLSELSVAAAAHATSPLASSPLAATQPGGSHSMAANGTELRPTLVGLRLSSDSASGGDLSGGRSHLELQQMSGIAEDELVPGGGTAASTTAAAIASSSPVGTHRSNGLSGGNNKPVPVISIVSSPRGSYLHTSGPPHCTTSPSNITHGSSSSKASSRLHQLGQENINTNACSSPVPMANHQHNNHLQIQQPHQQQQQQQQQHTHNGNNHNQHPSNPQSNGSYSPMISLQSHQGSVQNNGSSANHLFGDQNQASMGANNCIGIGNQALHAVNTGHMLHHQHQQQQPLQQPQQQHFGRSVGGGQSINGLLSGQTIVSRLGNCQHVSQWTANSIYNTMAQPDLVSAGGGSSSVASNGGLNGASMNSNSFPNMAGMINELRVGPRFLSALEHQTGPSNGGLGNLSFGDGAGNSPSVSHILSSAGNGSLNSRVGSSNGQAYY